VLVKKGSALIQSCVAAVAPMPQHLASGLLQRCQRA